MAPGAGDNLYVLAQGSGSTVLARLDGSRIPAPGWPISIPASSGCWLLLPVDDGSVRGVCQSGEDPDVTALRAFAFDTNGRPLAGWPVELPCCDGSRLVGRVIGDTLMLYEWRDRGDLAEGALVSIAADGTVRNGEPATYKNLYEQRWAIGPDGVAYGSINDLGDSVEAPKSVELLAVNFAGAVAGFPIAMVGLMSEPSFDAAGRIHVTVTSGPEGHARMHVFDTGGRVVGRSDDLGFVPSDECSGIEGSCEVPAAPLVGADGTTYPISVCCDGTTVLGVDTSGEVMAGWPYRSGAQYQAVGEPPPGSTDVDGQVNFAAPAIGPGSDVFVLNAAANASVGGSIVAISPDGRVRTGWPVVLQRPGAEFWSVVVGAGGTVYALAIEPEAGATFSASILAFAPDSTVLYTTTIVDP